MTNQSQSLKIRLALVEDGINNIGFRKFSAYVKSIHPDTKIAYIPTGNMQGLIRTLIEKGAGELSKNDIHKIAQFLAEGEIIGLSSMTQYSTTVNEIITSIRRLNPSAYIVWGGIHPIIYPEDAIKYADAVCTGEGEFAFKTFLELFKNKKDYTNTPSFWFRKDNRVIKNTNLPLMQQNEIDELPPLLYEDGELIYHNDKGFKTINTNDFLQFSGLAYSTVWSIGCPLKCTYCGNSKFIEYDKGYRRLRHSSPRTIVDEIKRAKFKQPHISTIVFHDDSFLALPYAVLEQFCKLWKAEVRIPFAVLGIIPNYVREDKIALLLDAGMNRVRMGIQSGSERILEFYKRPTKLRRIKEATKVINKYKKYMITPGYDIILENPIETSEDTRATLDLLYEMPRPFNANVFALRIIPNTELAKDFEKKGLNIPLIDQNYHSGFHRTLGNALVFAIVVWKMPRWLFKKLRNKVYPVQCEQPHYPILFKCFHTAYLVSRAFDYLRFLDFSLLPGKVGYFLWKFRIINFWQRFFLKHYQLNNKKTIN